MINGVLIVDKPVGMTSHDVVARCRRIVKQKRVGHAGTLDPGATGVLLVALGRATRLMRYVSELPKSYVGEIVLGASTTTLDDEGETIELWDMSAITIADMQAAASKFVGNIEQIPPMVSAIKVNGKRLHELARAGIEVERKPRPVTIGRIGISETTEAGVFRIEVDCSPGTYIRSLAADIGQSLGGGAHLRRLRRQAIGSFTSESAIPLDELMENHEPHILPATAMVSHLEALSVSAEMAADVSHGRAFDSTAVDVKGAGPWAVVDDGGDLLAVYEQRGAKLCAVVVIGADGAENR